MKFSKKNLAIIALVIILAASNVAFAVLYMTKNVSISGGVSVVGAIEIYQEDGVTPLTSYDFPLFTGGTGGVRYLYFFVNNTGNQPVYVTWNISTSSIPWVRNDLQISYEHMESGELKYYIRASDETHMMWWRPYNNGALPEETITLAVGAGIEASTELWYLGQPTTAETFSWVMSFYAKDTAG